MLTSAIFIADYRKTIRLRNRVGSLAIGTPETEIVAAVGAPDRISTPVRVLETGETVRGFLFASTSAKPFVASFPPSDVMVAVSAVPAAELRNKRVGLGLIAIGLARRQKLRASTAPREVPQAKRKSGQVLEKKTLERCVKTRKR